MNHTIRFGAILSLLVGVSVGSVPTQAVAIEPDGAKREGDTCSLKTLYGSYGFTIKGERLIPGSTQGAPVTIVPVSGVARTQYDGRGSLIQVDTINAGGKLLGSWRPARGSYVVNPDCTGSFVINFLTQPPLHANFVLVSDGRGIRAVVIDPNTSITSEGKKL